MDFRTRVEKIERDFGYAMLGMREALSDQIASAEESVHNSLRAVTQLLADKERVLQFGTWADWSSDDIRYLLEELRVGHWNDCGDTIPGYALTKDALGLVMELNFARRDREEIVFAGIRSLADTLSCFAGAEESRDLCEQIIALVDTRRPERESR